MSRARRSAVLPSVASGYPHLLVLLLALSLSCSPAPDPGPLRYPPVVVTSGSIVNDTSGEAVRASIRSRSSFKRL